ncbi:MAG: hypothetical protein AB1726_02390 [Planctomycetota bacterium]
MNRQGGIETAERAFGGALLDRLHGHGVSLALLRPADVRRIEAAGRGELIELLRRRHAVVPHRLEQAIGRLDPDSLAAVLRGDRRMLSAFLLLARSA